MKIVWYSNSPQCASGYGVQTKILTPKIRDLGHEVTIIASFGIEGGPLTYDGMTMLPRGIGHVDRELIEYQLKAVNPDIVITFHDAWALDAELFGPHWVPWFPVDREPYAKATLHKVKEAFMPIPCSKWGYAQSLTNGVDKARYIPCCYDGRDYYKIDKVEARAKLHLPEDKFIIGLVGANIGSFPRKAIPQALLAFHEFHAAHPDTALYLHTCLSDKFYGTNMWPILEDLNLKDAFFPCDQDVYLMGFPTWYMRDIYNSIDLLSAVACDEGFGVPIIEAQACGTPVVVGGWTAMPELVGAGGIVSKDKAVPFYDGTLGGWRYVPSPEGILEQYEKAYQLWKTDKSAYGGMSDDALHFAQGYEADRVIEDHWFPVLEELQDKIALSVEPECAEVC